MLGSFLAKKLFARDNSTSRKLKSRHKALARLKSRKAAFESLEDRRLLAGFVPGSIQGQEGWSGGTIAISPAVHQGVDQTGAFAHSGLGALLISNDTTLGNNNGAFSGWVFGPGLIAAAGQPSSGAPADMFTASYYFKSKNTVADGSNMEMDLGTVPGDDRNTFLAVTNDTDGDGGLKLRMAEPDGVTGDFLATQIVATGLTRNAWHRIDITAKFYNGDGNDTFEVKLDGASLINPNPASPNFNTPLFGTFEGFRNGIASPYALSNRLFFRSGAAASGFDGSFTDAGAQDFYFDDMTYQAALQSSPSTPLAVYAAGFEAQPSIVYVDDSWVGTIPGSDPDGAGPATSFGFDSFATINGGITAVANGGIVQVYAGNYPENVVVNKQVSMLGAKAGVDARGRVVGAPNPLVESVIDPAAGRPVELQDPADNTTLDGFAVVGSFSGATGVIESTTGATDKLKLLNNYVAVATGFNASALFLNKSAIDATIDQNEFVASPTSSQSVIFDGPDLFHGIHFTNNNVVRSSGVSGTGLFVDGNHNVSNIGSVGTPLFKGNLFQGFATGVNIGSRSFDNGEISENTFTGNSANGLQGGPQHTQILRNAFNNTGTGLAFTSFGSLAIDRGAQLDTVSENVFLNNATADVFFSAAQAPGTISSNTLANNSLGSAIGVTYGGAETIRASGNWWGANTNPEFTGTKISGAGAANVDYRTICI